MRQSKLESAHRIGIGSLVFVAVWPCVACAVDEDSVPMKFNSGGTAASTAGTGGTRSYGGSGGSQTVVSAGTSSGGANAAGTSAGGAGGASAGVAGGGSGSAGAAGTSTGTAGTGGSVAAPSICDGSATRLLTTSKVDALVDDFQAAALSPNWSHFSDVMPVPNSFKILQITDEGAATTLKSSRYQGTGAKTLAIGGYGVGIVYNVGINKAQAKSCVDISAFDGVSFWAKSGIADATVAVNFVVPETNAIKDGGDCAAQCYNHPRKTVSLTNQWAQYTVKFAEAAAGSAPVKSRVQMLAFLVPDAEDWDYSLDEIAWTKGVAPTGPVAP